MLGRFGNQIGLTVSFLLVGILTIGFVSADTEPNDDPSNPEIITEGTYTGSVVEIDGDYADWYRIDNIDNRTVKVTMKRQDYQDTEYVNANSYGAWAVTPDGQVNLYVGEGWSEDTCHWEDQDGLGTMFLQVTGNGQYELKIEFEGGGDDDDDDEGGGFMGGGSYCPFIIGGGIAAGIAVIAIGIIIASQVMKKP